MCAFRCNAPCVATSSELGQLPWIPAMRACAGMKCPGYVCLPLQRPIWHSRPQGGRPRAGRSRQSGCDSRVGGACGGGVVCDGLRCCGCFAVLLGVVRGGCGAVRWFAVLCACGAVRWLNVVPGPAVADLCAHLARPLSALPSSGTRLRIWRTPFADPQESAESEHQIDVHRRTCVPQ